MLAALALFAAFQLSAAQPSEAKLVLGAHKFMPAGFGWGASRPKAIFNGGVPNGLVSKIRWRDWGDKVAKADGRGSQYKPSGGYYAKRVRVKLRAKRISRCRPKGPRAYTVLLANFQEKPGGRFGGWFRWSGAGSICG